MAAAQTKARGILEEHGVKMADPTAEQTAAARKQMLAEQDQLAKDIKVSPEMVKLIMAEVGSGS
jgi:C4-dicarboxylate-binding protein DctP